MNQPLVSIGLQFFNNESTLALAIRSILYQSYTNWELILHNDGSRDRSLEIAQSFQDERIRLFTDTVNRGRSTRLNESICLAQGKYYAVMDGDDVSYPDRLMRQVEFMEKHPDVDLVGGQLLVFSSHGRPLGRRYYPLQHEEICRNPARGFPFAHATLLGKLEFFKRYRYRPVALLCEDQDLLLRAYSHSRFANLGEIVYGYYTDRVDLKKAWVARRALSQILWRTFLEKGQINWAVRAVTMQAAGMLLDWMAVSTGLNYRLLRHRAAAITAQERDAWMGVWEKIGAQHPHV